MKATYGFHATMTARAGKGDELVETLLSAVEDDGPAANPNCVFFLVTRSAADRDVVHVTEGWTSKQEMFTAKLAALIGGEAKYSDDVPVGGRFNL